VDNGATCNALGWETLPIVSAHRIHGSRNLMLLSNARKKKANGLHELINYDSTGRTSISCAM
jgi:hypothetical protein